MDSFYQRIAEDPLKLNFSILIEKSGFVEKMCLVTYYILRKNVQNTFFFEENYQSETRSPYYYFFLLINLL